MQFCHLHLHTQYSLLDGANKLPDIIELAHSLGQPAIGMTDHGNMHGAVEFYVAAKKIGIKPIIGCELYVTPGSRFERKTRAQGGAGTHHLTVLAKDMEGYQNLCRLVSRAYKEGFYFKPRVDHELLAEYHKGLIVMSGCLSGELSHFATIEDMKRGRSLVEWYAKTFEGRYFLEVQPHAIREQARLNQACAELGRDVGVPLVATNDCHYPRKEDHYAQEVLMCISTGKQITDPDRMRHEGVEIYLKTGDEVLASFNGASWAEEAVRNSVDIASRCDLSFDFKTYYMPKFKSEDTRPFGEIMAERAREGLERRVDSILARGGSWTPEVQATYRARLELEITLIEKMGFSGYFLVVSDFIVWAKEHGIPVGPGRGSVAGSLVAFAMRITDVDPIANKLLFERFLNPERISLPDIDVDFCINGRDRVIKYVVEKYGKDNVAQIATFGTLKAKAVLKDVGRALGLSYAETDRVAQLVPAPRQGFDYPLAEAIKMEKRLSDYAEGEGKELISLALKLEGLTRHSSTHAAGVVIADRPLMDLLPMMVDKDGNDVTQYSMTYVEKVGLVKFDFLGLKTLTVIHTVLDLIRESRGEGEKIDLEVLPLNDAATYALLAAGNTTGVFQLESGGITDMTVRLKPNCFDDLVAILALYRPGPLDAGMVDHYIHRKHGREPVSYLHPLMESTLSDTYGIMLYQEQIMQLARVLAGYSLGEADILRKAMGKKIPEEMAKQRSKFLTGAKANGLSDKLANEIFDQMETFARYGFNRSHSAAYALISYYTAYLKTHYNVEFMAGLMSLEMEDSDKTLKNLTECRKQNIEVLPPHINLSGAGFTVREGKIQFGLEAIKGIGSKAVSAVLAARAEGGDFKDLEDLLERVSSEHLNRRVIEGFITSGAFDYTGVSRREMYESLDDLLKAAQRVHSNVDTSQISLFGGGDSQKSIPRRRTNSPEWPVNKRLSFEREALGFYISGHPLDKLATDLKRLGAIATTDARALTRSCEVRIGGVVTGLKLKNTKKGDRYATFVLEDARGTLEAIVWPDTYQKVSAIMAGEDPVVVAGKLDVAEERCTLIVSTVESLIRLRDERAKAGVIMLSEKDRIDESLPRLTNVLQKYRGKCPVRVRLMIDSAEVSIVLKNDRAEPICVQPSESLCDEVEQIFGRPVLSFM